MVRTVTNPPSTTLSRPPADWRVSTPIGRDVHRLCRQPDRRQDDWPGGRRMPCWQPCFIASAMATANMVEVPMLETMTAFVLAEHMGGMTFPSGSAATGRLCAAAEGADARPVAHAAMAGSACCPIPPARTGWPSSEAAGREDLVTRATTSPSRQRTRNRRHPGALWPPVLEKSSRRAYTDEWLALCDELDIPATRLYTLV